MNPAGWIPGNEDLAMQLLSLPNENENMKIVVLPLLNYHWQEIVMGMNLRPPLTDFYFLLFPDCRFLVKTIDGP